MRKKWKTNASSQATTASWREAKDNFMSIHKKQPNITD